MCNEVKALCIKRKQLEMQLERNEEKGGECITLTKGECEELFEVMRAAEEQFGNWFGHGLQPQAKRRGKMSEAKKDESGLSDLLWRDIGTAPKDGTEILTFRDDAGIFISRWDCAASFLTSDEIEAMDMSDDDLHAEDWFCADFVCGSRLDGDLAPALWMPLPSEP